MGKYLCRTGRDAGRGWGRGGLCILVAVSFFLVPFRRQRLGKYRVQLRTSSSERAPQPDVEEIRQVGVGHRIVVRWVSDNRVRSIVWERMRGGPLAALDLDLLELVGERRAQAGERIFLRVMPYGASSDGTSPLVPHE